MLRRLRITATACFTTLAVAFVVLWVSSYWKSVDAWAKYDWEASVRSSGGRLLCDYHPHAMLTCGTVPPPPRGVHACVSDYDAPADQDNFSEFYLSDDLAEYASTIPVADFHTVKLIDDVYVAFPHRLAVLTCASLAAIAWIRVPIRFSLRSMLLATAAVAALLGILAKYHC